MVFFLSNLVCLSEYGDRCLWEIELPQGKESRVFFKKRCDAAKLRNTKKDFVNLIIGY